MPTTNRSDCFVRQYSLLRATVPGSLLVTSIVERRGFDHRNSIQAFNVYKTIV